MWKSWSRIFNKKIKIWSLWERTSLCEKLQYIFPRESSCVNNVYRSNVIVLRTLRSSWGQCFVLFGFFLNISRKWILGGKWVYLALHDTFMLAEIVFSQICTLWKNKISNIVLNLSPTDPMSYFWRTFTASLI